MHDITSGSFTASMQTNNYSIRETEGLKLWLELVRTSNQFFSKMDEKFRQHYGQSISRFDVLSQLAREDQGELSIGELGSLLIASKGNITGLLQRMSKDKLVIKKANPLDGRSFQIKISAKGLNLFNQMATSHASWTAEFFKSKSVADIRAMTVFLNEIRTSTRNDI